MSQNNKVSMPSSQGGLVRYFDDYKSKIEFKPGYIVLFVVLIIVFEIILHQYGNSLFGI